MRSLPPDLQARLAALQQYKIKHFSLVARRVREEQGPGYVQNSIRSEIPVIAFYTYPDAVPPITDTSKDRLFVF